MPLAPHDTLQVLRVAQEALTNTLKHAKASQVHVSLRREGQTLVLAVEDDGSGGALPAREGGRGLGNMRARAARIGAQLDLRLTGPGLPGSQVVLRLPLPSPAAPLQPEPI